MLSSLSQIDGRGNHRPPPVDFAGVWFSELGAKLTLLVDAAGRVSGSFRTAAGSPSLSHEFVVTGFVSGDLISFCADSGTSGSVTCWVGHRLDTPLGPTIRTMWLLARNVEDQEMPGSMLGAVLTGSNNFSR